MIRILELYDTDLLSRFKDTPIEELTVGCFSIEWQEIAKYHEVKFISPDKGIKYFKRRF